MGTRKIDSRDVLVVTHVNATEGYVFSEHDEPLSDAYFAERVDDDTWELDTGDLYRAAMREYGRCIGRVYVDGADGRAATVGWAFVKRERYEDTGEPFLLETWTALARRNPRWTFERTAA